MRRPMIEQRKHACGIAGRRLLIMVGLLLSAVVAGRAQDLRAGYAKADITPTGPVGDLWTFPFLEILSQDLR